jgi:hypothetical protein
LIVHYERREKRTFKCHGRDWKPEKVVLRLLEEEEEEGEEEEEEEEEYDEEEEEECLDT